MSTRRTALYSAEFRHNSACFKAPYPNPETSMLSSRRNVLSKLALPISLVAALTVSAVAQEGTAPAETAPAETPAPVAPVQRDPAAVVATIEGQPVTEADLALGLASVDQQYSQLPPEQRRA